jgi:hypothetical protein
MPGTGRMTVAAARLMPPSTQNDRPFAPFVRLVAATTGEDPKLGSGAVVAIGFDRDPLRDHDPAPPPDE